MDTTADPLHHHKKLLHGKRPGKHSPSADSPAYDASEEDNDPLTDDGASTVSIPVSRNHQIPSSPLSQARGSGSSRQQQSHLPTSSSLGVNGPGPGQRILPRQHFERVVSEDSGSGVDSPTYDGDIESSAKGHLDVGTGYHKGSAPTGHGGGGHGNTSSTSTLTSPVTTTFPTLVYPQPASTEHLGAALPPVQPNISTSVAPLSVPDEPAPVPAAAAEFDPARLTTEDVQEFVRRAIAGVDPRPYKINTPPVGRPVRIYADGVYDLFHFGHALQLRQAKAAFPSVYLLVGVCSDELVREHKARSVMNHAERCEAVRHCRWVDEVVPDAPWIIDGDFVEKWQIDYVAHDEDPYAASGHDDVYSFAKSQGKFLPTRRTPGVSTSELLERIVSGYRNKEFDPKLEKMGHPELKAEGSDFDDSPTGSRAHSRVRGRRAGLTPIGGAGGNGGGKKEGSSLK
ncbi:hypothetical protein BD410DRAFT_741128 [Rickenella mellea]|uniref:choline-phosphate cytidylyltransferase n=1 Tax=Rickenella mellea TaxID=50990 RepID=A0A4Y7QHN0_9AGAM|nr:hypothetical protein BD410DRAFT_741128 [Rickenella mellea]